LKSIGQTGVFLPAMVVVIVLAGGAGGSLIVTVLALSVLVALHLSPTVAAWFEEGEERVGTVTAYVLGLTRPEIVSNRIVPQILRRLIGVFVSLIPLIALAEMGLSFLGFTGGRLSCGDLIAKGGEVIIEAPWMAVCPGILATLIVIILTLLGWLSSRFLKTGILPRWI
jgi:peptide/nickel transport system permease protein